MHHAHLSRTALVALCFAMVEQPASADDKALLTVSTERSSPGEARPSRELVQIILGSFNKDDVQQLDDCLSEKGLKPDDYASLLLTVEIPAGEGRSLWFVRPALKPYCFSLYGAHLFRYFLVEERRGNSQHRYRLLFHNGGDFFTVYRQQSHGLNDIEATGCIASECSTMRMSFDGAKYQPVRCARTTWDDNHRQVTEPRPCGSDQWQNDQSSGFSRPSGN